MNSDAIKNAQSFEFDQHYLEMPVGGMYGCHILRIGVKFGEIAAWQHKKSPIPEIGLLLDTVLFS